MSESQPLRRELLRDIQRMAPVWAIVFASVAGTLFVLRHTGRTYIEKGLYESGDVCTVAGIRAAAGEAIYVKLKLDAESKRKGQVAADPAAARKAALGLMKGDPRVAEARAHLEAAAKICPGYEHLHYDLSELALWDGSLGLSHFHLGLYQLSRKEPDAARLEFQLATEELPDAVEPRIALASVLLDDGDTSAASAAIEPIRDLAAKDATGLGVLARFEIARGNDDGAKKLLLDALRLEPSNQPLSELLRGVAERMKDPAEAGRMFAEIAAFPGSHAAGMHHLAGLYFNRAEMWKEAESEIRPAAALAPNNVQVIFDHAVALARIGKFDEARDVYNRALAIDVDKAVLLRSASPVDPLKRP